MSEALARTLLAAACLAVSVSLPAQDAIPEAPHGYAAEAGPTITGDAEADAYHLVRLELKGLPVGATAFWDADRAGTGDEGDGQEVENGRYFVFTGPPGSYRVKATYIVDGKMGRARFTAKIGKGANPPPPIDEPVTDPTDPVTDPDRPVTPPDDKPAPGPAKGPLWVMVLIESQQQTPPQAAVLRDKALWDAVTAAGHSYRVLDPTDTDAVTASAKSVAAQAKVPPPALILSEQSGKVLKVVPLPATGSELWSLVKGASGK